MYLSVTPHVHPTHTFYDSEGNRLPNIFMPNSEYDLSDKTDESIKVLLDEQIKITNDLLTIMKNFNSKQKIIIDSLKSGKYVFCEKPIAANLSEAEEIYEITKKYPNKLQIGSNHRYFESVKFAKKLIQKLN